MPDNPKVSVLLATYGHARFIERTIDSVLAQTFQDFEIVVVNDGSPDDTMEVLAGIKDARVRVFELPYNQGIAAASNEGLRHCRGEYVAILDSDDLYHPQKLEKQVAFLDAHPEYGSVCCHAALIDEDDRPYENKRHPYYSIFKKKNRSRAQWLRRFFFKGNCICHPAVMARKSVMDAVGPYDVAMQQLPDFDIVVRLVAQAPFFMMEEVLVFVRVREEAANNSAYSAEKELRSQFEYVSLLEPYARLEPELAAAVFDKFTEGVPVTARAVPYLAARAALSMADSPYIRYFGEITLARMLRDERTRAFLRERYGFTTKKFYELLGTYKVFDAPHIDFHRLAVDRGLDFSDPQTLERPVRDFEGKGNLLVDTVFELPPRAAGARAFRWVPTKSGACSVRLDRFSVRDAEGNWHDIPPEKLLTNAVSRVQDAYIFTSGDPFLAFETDFEGRAVRVACAIEYGAGLLAHRFADMMQASLEQYAAGSIPGFGRAVLKLVHVETGNELTHLPAGAAFRFQSREAPAEGVWIAAELDHRLLEQNGAVAVEGLCVWGTDRGGNRTEVLAQAVAPVLRDGSLLFEEGLSALYLLPGAGTVNLCAQGTVRRFSDWDDHGPAQPRQVPGHPLGRVEYRYAADGKMEQSFTGAVMEGDTAVVCFYLPELSGGVDVTMCAGETFGALRVKEAYCIDDAGVKTALEYGGGDWRLFGGVDPPVVGFSAAGEKKGALIVIKYDIIFGRRGAVVKKIAKQSPAQAAKLALNNRRGD